MERLCGEGRAVRVLDVRARIQTQSNPRVHELCHYCLAITHHALSL